MRIETKKQNEVEKIDTLTYFSNTIVNFNKSSFMVIQKIFVWIKNRKYLQK